MYQFTPDNWGVCPTTIALAPTASRVSRRILLTLLEKKSGNTLIQANDDICVSSFEDFGDSSSTYLVNLIFIQIRSLS